MRPPTIPLAATTAALCLLASPAASVSQTAGQAAGQAREAVPQERLEALARAHIEVQRADPTLAKKLEVAKDPAEDLSQEEQRRVGAILERNDLSFDEMAELQRQVFSSEPAVARFKMTEQRLRSGQGQSGSVPYPTGPVGGSAPDATRSPDQ